MLDIYHIKAGMAALIKKNHINISMPMYQNSIVFSPFCISLACGGLVVFD